MRSPSPPFTPGAAPIAIGDTARPPFAVMPEPGPVFGARAARFRALAPDHPLEPYLAFLGDLAAAQQRVADALPLPPAPDPARLAVAAEHGMPAIDRGRIGASPDALRTLDALFDAALGIAMPDQAAAGLDAAREARGERRAAMIEAVLGSTVPAETAAAHVFVAAGLDIHLARLAATLDPDRLVPISEGCLCPACGGPPVSSAIVGWSGAHGTRFATCAHCATRWNVVRVKCTLCASTKGISYRAIEGDTREIAAECCDECRRYVKILSQHKDPALDPVADDVASLGLDLLVKEEGYGRGAVNPYLLGY